MEKGIGFMEKNGTYIVAVVMVSGGKWYLRCFRWGLVSFFLFEVLDGFSVWVEVWEKVFLLVPTFWKVFRFSYLEGCFVMGRLW